MPRQLPVPARRALAVLLVVPALAAAGCGAATTTVGPAGVDELVVPTPDVDPADFRRGIDNPWLALSPGRTWTYSVTAEDGARSTRTVHVEEPTLEAAGVAATVVRTREGATETVDLYAEDRRGNVWWLGRQGEWRADLDGARAGLLLAASPRFGDGHRAAYLPGEVDERVSVVDVDATVEVDGRTWGGLVTVDATSPHRPGLVERRWYAEGAGLVRSAVFRGDPERGQPVETAELTDIEGG